METPSCLFCDTNNQTVNHSHGDSRFHKVPSQHSFRYSFVFPNLPKLRRGLDNEKPVKRTCIQSTTTCGCTQRIPELIKRESVVRRAGSEMNKQNPASGCFRGQLTQKSVSPRNRSQRQNENSCTHWFRAQSNVTDPKRRGFPNRVGCVHGPQPKLEAQG